MAATFPQSLWVLNDQVPKDDSDIVELKECSLKAIAEYERKQSWTQWPVDSWVVQ
jgi:hypothetical protein